MSLLMKAWRCKWGVVRLAAAAFILWVLVADTGARLARAQLAALPGFDYAQEVQALRAQGRFGEAVMVADAGLADADDRQEIEAERQKTIEEQSSYLRKAAALGMGALSGRADSLEGLVGAVAADFFVVGDVRDLVVEGGKQMLDGDSDELVLLLSVVGVVTTVAPEVDWVPSILKAAKRTGSITKPMSEYLVKAIKGKKSAELRVVFEDAAALAGKASPGGAVRLLRHADDPADLATMARFVEKHPGGAFALHVTGGEGLDVVKRAGAAGEAVVIRAAAKGRAGARFLRMPAARLLLKPHPLIGLAKGLWKGNVEKLITRSLDRIDHAAWWAVPLVAFWVLVEVLLLARTVLGGRVPSCELEGQRRDVVEA